jgi:uncharacterized membrane protein YkoI
VKPDLTRRTLLLTLALMPVGARVSYADSDDDDDDKDHYRAGQAVAQGRAQPLSEIIKEIHAQMGGDVVGVKFKSKNGRYIYKLKVVAGGKLRELSVDAATGQILGDDD